jgi:hypothetical protein
MANFEFPIVVKGEMQVEYGQLSERPSKIIEEKINGCLWMYVTIELFQQPTSFHEQQ